MSHTKDQGIAHEISMATAPVAQLPNVAQPVRRRFLHIMSLFHEVLAARAGSQLPHPITSNPGPSSCRATQVAHLNPRGFAIAQWTRCEVTNKCVPREIFIESLKVGTSGESLKNSGEESTYECVCVCKCVCVSVSKHLLRMAFECIWYRHYRHQTLIFIRPSSEHLQTEWFQPLSLSENWVPPNQAIYVIILFPWKWPYMWLQKTSHFQTPKSMWNPFVNAGKITRSSKIRSQSFAG